jgi:Flp pilus assembly protein TadG
MAGLRKTHLLWRQRGAVAIEYALILPILLLLVLGTMDVGRLLWTYTALSHAAEAAARCAAVNTTTCGNDAQIRTYATSQAWGLNVSASDFTVSKPSCGVQIKATYDFAFIVPWFPQFGGTPLGTITLDATACYPA